MMKTYKEARYISERTLPEWDVPVGVDSQTKLMVKSWIISTVELLNGRVSDEFVEHLTRSVTAAYNLGKADAQNGR